ncbi:polyprotein [Hirsutella rhossiliensis]|uniref:Polyprotein n=1 Tax=Hirsutella rhossiliensis TaxID=111463 RepID=A0A9P8MV61_9HYPO|nr:polyprotein [Hirsutella rhossiliensis]KAH0962768.1 polyprotein [Hirsutella rhossiliensis]
MDPNDHYYLDRRYNNNRGRFGQKGYRSQRFNRPQGRYGHNHPWNKKCFVCNKEGCIYFNNLTDTIVGRTTLPVIRKWGHPWFLLPKTNEAAIAFLTESEIRTLHRRFGHPAVPRLHNLLRQAGHNDVTIDILENISRFCHHCQMHSQAPRRFKFTLKDDQEFNYEIVADVLYLGTPQRPVLHVDTWEALRALWIDTYLGPPDTIKHDAGTNFASLEFRNEVERYHAPLRPINDTTGPNGIVPTLLVFGAYPRMALDSPPSATTLKRAAAAQKAMKMLRQLSAEREVRNKPKTTFLVKKEEDAYQLAIKLRDEGIITTPGTPFEESDSTEIDDLLVRVFSFERYNEAKHGNHHIFRSRMVREVKGHNDQEKTTLLTQSPTIQRGPDNFGIVGMQTDDTLMLGTQRFSALEEAELVKAQFRAKPKTTMTPGTSIDFNAKIEPIDIKAYDRAQQYVEQRVQTPTEEDCTTLNKRLQWQKDHQQRGLTYIPIDLANAKLIIFTDGSFANNKDLSSQLGFVIALGNVLHWSSTKCKRVTRSVLASEIYGMVNGFDIGISLATTIRKITDRLNLPLSLIVCTDSFSLYECLVKLGTTKEKRLMIDIMALRQSYERREITEIRWINGADNPADAMTKASPNRALERLVDTNSLTIRIEGSVERPPASCRSNRHSFRTLAVAATLPHLLLLLRLQR